jgi:hypothetical protein
LIIYFDILLVLFLLVFLYQNKYLDFLNPTFLYLIIHIFFITYKGVQNFIFNSTISSNNWYDIAINLNDISKAILIDDLSLISFFIGFYFYKKKYSNTGVRLQRQYKIIIEERPRLLKLYLGLVVILGFIGMASYSFIPGVELDDIEGNTFTNTLSSLGIISALILVYQFGFKLKYNLFFGVMILVYSVQGGNRYRVILPLLFILLLYLKIKNLKIPPLKFIILGFFIILLSFPLKQIGKTFQEDNRIDLIDVVTNSFEDFTEGKSGDLEFIEQSAAMISNIDEKGVVFYGRTYTPILFFWIPRVFWKEKPKMNDWQWEISSVGRDFGQMGQISLIGGESYANFRWLGVFLIPFIVGRFYSFLYYSYSSLPYNHKGFLLLLFYNMIIFQAWRDGLISLILFPIVYYSPLFILYWIKKTKKHK